MSPNRLSWSSFSRPVVLTLAALALGTTGCKRDLPKPPPDMRVVELRRVPLAVAVPADWKKARDNPRWLVFEPGSRHAFVALSGDRDCTLVEKRLYSELINLGLSRVQWNASPKELTDSSGLRTTRASGHGMADGKKANLAYSLVRAPKRRGCLVTLVMTDEQDAKLYADVADKVLGSIRSVK